MASPLRLGSPNAGLTAERRAGRAKGRRTDDRRAAFDSRHGRHPFAGLSAGKAPTVLSFIEVRDEPKSSSSFCVVGQGWPARRFSFLPIRRNENRSLGVSSAFCQTRNILAFLERHGDRERHPAKLVFLGHSANSPI
jgi:hypothetical protein